jgi:putative transcriptional regulator
MRCGYPLANGETALRGKSGQAEFSRRYAVSPRSLQEWEQGRRWPESAVRASLTVIDRNPQAVEKALMNKP